MAKLVDAADSKSAALYGCVGSSPTAGKRTSNWNMKIPDAIGTPYRLRPSRRRTRTQSRGVPQALLRRGTPKPEGATAPRVESDRRHNSSSRSACGISSTPLSADGLERSPGAYRRRSCAEEERERRNIIFHSLRAFGNTAALNSAVIEHVLSKVTGHKTAQMTSHFTRPNVAYMTAITELQKDLVKPKK